MYRVRSVRTDPCRRRRCCQPPLNLHEYRFNPPPRETNRFLKLHDRRLSAHAAVNGGGRRGNLADRRHSTSQTFANAGGNRRGWIAVTSLAIANDKANPLRQAHAWF